MNGNRFLERLEGCMRDSGLSRSALSRQSGVNLNTIHGYWKYERIPRGDDLVRIASALGTTAEYLVAGKHPVRERDDDPLLFEIMELVRKLDRNERLQMYGAVKMLLFMRLSGSQERLPVP
jgi:transcriptional regulator with XRE-family HTH domain